MSALLLLAIWAGASLVVGAYAWALARAAAIGDREDLQLMSRARVSPLVLARSGPADRRASRRPWGNQAPGRRSGDALRWEVEEAERALRRAEAELASYEARHGHDAA